MSKPKYISPPQKSTRKTLLLIMLFIFIIVFLYNLRLVTWKLINKCDYGYTFNTVTSTCNPIFPLNLVVSKPTITSIPESKKIKLNIKVLPWTAPESVEDPVIGKRYDLKDGFFEIKEFMINLLRLGFITWHIDLLTVERK